MKFLFLFFTIFSLTVYAQSWQVAGVMPFPVSGGQAVVYGSKIYIMGGFSETLNSKVNLIQEYDPLDKKWSIIDTMKAKRSDFISGIYSDSVFYAGGTSEESSNSSSIEVWDFKSAPKIYKAENYFDREYLTGQIVNGNLYIFGGSIHEDDSHSPYMFEYNLNKSKVTYTDNSIYPSVYPSKQMSAVLGNYIYIFGGATEVLSNSILRFDLQAKSFNVLSTELYKPRAGGIAVPFQNKEILIIGGFDETNQALSSVEIFSVNGNNTEITQGPSLNYARVDPIAVNYLNNIYVFGGMDKNGQPVPQIEVLGSVSTVVSSNKELPDSFDLENNYPNPFNPSTQIKFKIAHYTRVSVDIYSILGQHIKNLTSKYYQPGEYYLTWNGENNYGSLVPSGVYIYRLTCNYYSASKKMILLK